MDAVKITGYSVAAVYNRTERIHGGSIILIRDEIKFKNCSQLSRFNVEMHFESASTTAIINEKKICIIVIYRPPNGNVNLFFTNLAYLLNIAVTASDYLVLCGDLNINLLSNSIESKILIDLFDSYNLTNKNSTPTRIAMNRNNIVSQSAIDYMVTTIPMEYYEYETIDLNLSDHLANLIVVTGSILSSADNVGVEEARTTRRRHMTTSNLDNFKSALHQVDWSTLDCANVDSAFHTFLETFLWLFHQTCPITTTTGSRKRNSTSTPWFTSELVRMRNELKSRFSLLKVTTYTQINVALYNLAKREYRRKIKQTKQNYYNNIISNAQNKPKTLWKIVNRETGRQKKRHNIALSEDNTLITNPQQIGHMFGNYFASAASDLTKHRFGDKPTSTVTCSKISNCRSLYVYPVTQDEVTRASESLAKSSSSGEDEITVKVLDHVLTSILPIITMLYNESLAHGIFPSALKTARVIAVFKSGDPTKIENYRPISLLSVFSKLLEKIVYNRITSFVNKFSILPASQHGFRPGKSTESATFDLLTFIYEELDKKKYISVLFFDISRAFDTINCENICYKLQKLGIRGPMLMWIKSFLSNRQLYVDIEGVKSDKFDVTLGVAQGSVLGPLLYLLYVADLPNHVTSAKVISYADDTTIAISAKTLECLTSTIKHVDEEFHSWCSANKLVLNANKTVCVNFGRAKQELETSSVSLNTKFLGILIDDDLSWDQHIKNVCKKLNRAYYVLRNLKSCLDINSLVTVYYALAYPHLAYNVVAWGAAVDKNRVFILLFLFLIVIAAFII
uniref:Reverse transcriptase domain-containing protein n=1 Tax=Photinus pyralis TaxID=7054 RepID=A0A1Y1LN06_PHOPY